ncbi:MAG: PQQ-binding-like beta-propeller repeat protein [Acidobacteriota bacterium]|nr:PQQ-binding-like beta-propeller repeat protein [Acidobacteriota bacterium]
MNRILLVLSTVALALGAPPPHQYASKDWSVTGGPGSAHYSTLTQINRKNVETLQKAWQFDSGDEFDSSEMECNPLVLDGVVYAATPRLRMVALDGATGKLLWDFDPRRGQKIKSKQRVRGFAYWGDGDQRRIFVGVGSNLYALNAKTGQPIPEFGDNGHIDLHVGLGDQAKGLTVEATSPGVVYKDLLIQGSLVAEDLPAAPGHIRAFDVHTGKLRWIFHTIPQSGEYGYDTWPKDAYKYIGGANSWAGMTLDPRLGLVFVPTGSAAFDFYGANRIGDNLFANCLLALNAETGERVWYYQFVKHDVLDRDLPAAPTLVQVRQHGKLTDAVAQITKNGFVWLFDEKTGKLLVPLQTINVPQSDVDGEVTSTTQVLPTSPLPYARQRVTEDTLTDRTPEAHAAVLAQFKNLLSGPQFTPASFKGTVVFPGFDGGGEWGGSAWDPKTHILYVNSNEMAWILRLVPRVLGTEAMTGSTLYRQNCSGCHRLDRKGSPPEFPSLIDIGSKLSREQVVTMVTNGGGRMPGFGRLGTDTVNAIVDFVTTGKDVRLDGAEHQKRLSYAGLKYGIDGYNQFLDPQGYPAVKPPWGTLNAINLDTMQYVWKQPFGEFPELVAKGIRNTGSENYGGGVVTAGGLLFIGATDHDRKFHVYDSGTGKLLWETTLPAGGNATPAVYEANGHEYVVIAAGGGRRGELHSGGSYVAFALP